MWQAHEVALTSCSIHHPRSQSAIQSEQRRLLSGQRGHAFGIMPKRSCRYLQLQLGSAGRLPVAGLDRHVCVASCCTNGSASLFPFFSPLACNVLGQVGTCPAVRVTRPKEEKPLLQFWGVPDRPKSWSHIRFLFPVYVGASHHRKDQACILPLGTPSGPLAVTLKPRC